MTHPIPVIDIAPFRQGLPGAAATLEALRQAAEGTGFFLVTGHGVDEARTRTLYDAARAFFDLPGRAVDTAAPPRPGGVGYAPLRAEALAATRGEASPGDLKQSLNYGPRLPGAPWPADPPGLRAAFEGYFAEMEALAQVLRRMFCAAVGLPEDRFEPDFVGHLSALRVIDYPEQTEAPLPGQLRAGAHTDYGFMTILRSEASPGGLQVQGPGGAWIDVPALEGAFVINIGDAFMRWTNDRWRSTPHRVANPPPQAGRPTRRQSIPFFVNPSAATVIDCLPGFAGTGVRHAPITYGELIAQKTAQAFGAG
ncbi:MAG: isopenicillin N synthase family oxygenase [Rhodobacteraceae bacterium]|jgi:isopenicillin N synthase-like dioxygenase|nr:isopenicillin N synthase family oxygenase [Paracoccaceae bacterium]